MDRRTFIKGMIGVGIGCFIPSIALPTTSFPPINMETLQKAFDKVWIATEVEPNQIFFLSYKYVKLIDKRSLWKVKVR